ncbi:MAG: GNAT family N-acetyltransferase, partial [Phycisphaerae bacterium]
LGSPLELADAICMLWVGAGSGFTKPARPLDPVGVDVFDAQLDIREYDPVYGATVARWVHSPRELFWLAPSTSWPLTGDTVSGWVVKPTDQALLLFEAGREIPCGYAELNLLRDSTRHLWIGHVVIDPARRGRSLGRRFVGMLAERAFADPDIERLTMVVFPENTGAVSCYEAVGFRITSRERHRFGSDKKEHLMLRLELTRHQADRYTQALAWAQ